MLTANKIKTLESRARRYIVTDAAGLGLEILPSGVMSWRFRYTHRKRQNMINLGRYPQISIAEARQRRAEFARGIADGKSPIEQRRAAQIATERGQTVKEFSERYLREIVARARKKPELIRRAFEREVWPTIGSKPLAEVTRADLRELIWRKRDGDPESGVQGRPQAALALRDLLKRMWDYAEVCEVAERNPLAAIKPKFIAETTSRSRALEPHELGAFLRALDDARIRPDLKAALQLILLTLTRKGEMRLARWEEFNLERGEWTIPEAHSKTVAQIVYLSSQAVALLREQRARHPHSSVVFPMRGALHTPISASTLNRALERVPVRLEHFTVHDLRRSAATNLSEQEYPADVIEKALNHKIRGVRGVYNRAQYAKQRREMLQAWADCLDRWKRSETSAESWV